MSLLRHFVNYLRLNERTNIDTFKKNVFYFNYHKKIEKKLYEIWRLFYGQFPRIVYVGAVFK